MSLCQKLKFSITISLQPDVVDLYYFNIKGLNYQVGKIEGLEYLTRTQFFSKVKTKNA